MNAILRRKGGFESSRNKRLELFLRRKKGLERTQVLVDRDRDTTGKLFLTMADSRAHASLFSPNLSSSTTGLLHTHEQ